MRFEYSPAERAFLWSLAVVGLVGVNGAFVYGLVQPGVMNAALTNPISLAFMVEAIVLLIAFAYLLTKWRVSRLSPLWFVALSFLGSMAFALPVALLWRGGQVERSAAGTGRARESA